MRGRVESAARTAKAHGTPIGHLTPKGQKKNRYFVMIDEKDQAEHQKLIEQRIDNDFQALDRAILEAEKVRKRQEGEKKIVVLPSGEEIEEEEQRQEEQYKNEDKEQNEEQ